MPSTATSSITEVTSSDPGDRARRERRVVSLVIAAGVALFWLICTSWRPWDLFAEAGFSADFYDEQARSFVRGRLSVRPEVAGIEGFVVDGKTYLYYGPFLAIVRVPLALFGDVFVGRMVRISMLVALVVLGRWTARLARSGRRLVGGARESTSIWPTVTLVSVTVFSPALFAAGWVSVYHETEIWAFALAVVSMTLLVEWLHSDGTDRRTLWWTIAAITATTLTRSPIGLGLAAALGAIGLWLAWRSRADRGSEGWTAIGGAMVPAVAASVVNLAKFGTLFSVPGDQQVLSLQQPERAAFFEATGGSFFDLRFLPTTIAQYLRPDAVRFERLVPGIRFGPLAENRGSLDVESVTPASSLPVTATALLLVGVVGLVWLVRRRHGAWLVVVAGGVLGAVPTFLIGFIANRYLIDMLPPLVSASAVGVWVVASWGRSDQDDVRRRRVLAVAGTTLVVWGAWVNGALATWTLELKSPGFTELRSDVDSALFGGGDVGVSPAIDASAPVPRDGLVGTSPACEGTYIAEQGSWVNLERATGIYEASGTIDAEVMSSAPVRIASTSSWTVDVLSLDVGGVAFVHATPADPDAAVVTVDAPYPIEYRVVADPVTGESFLEVAGTVSLLPGAAVDSVTVDGIAPGASAPSPTTAPLCTKLVDRL